jgi:hypothetical protein
MSRKSVLTTIRPSFFNLNLSNLNNKFYLLSLNFLKSFDQLMLKKGVFSNKTFMNFSGNTLVLKSSLFITTNLLKSLKKKSVKAQILKNSGKNPGLLEILKSLISKLRLTSVVTNFKIINKNLNKKYLFFLFKKLKKYMFKLFNRRFSLFLDFLKITCLYAENLIDIKVYAYFIATVFKNLRKRAHINFYGFIKKIFNILVFESAKFVKKPGGIKGVKLLIKGRLLGKPRSSKYKIQVGSVPVQTISSSIEYAQATSFTHDCGTFGFEIWLNR